MRAAGAGTAVLVRPVVAAGLRAACPLVSIHAAGAATAVLLRPVVADELRAASLLLSLSRCTALALPLAVLWTGRGPWLPLVSFGVEAG